MKGSNITALGLIVLAALWRVQLVWHPALFNVTPVTALAFCGAVYFRDWRFWLVPFAALTLSDLWLDRYYATHFGYTWPVSGAFLRAMCVLAAHGIGLLVAARRNAVNLVSGTLGCSTLFYLVTNTVSWFGDAHYAGTVAGWWQAMTVGHPEFPPTLWFFRNTLVGDLIFTGLFAATIRAADGAQHCGARDGITE